jgi:hypothetical protein
MQIRKCRQCGGSNAVRVRESEAKHGSHLYSMAWFQCSACADVSFSYDRVAESPVSVAAPTAQPIVEDESPSAPEAVLTP